MNIARSLLKCIKFYRDRNAARRIIAGAKLPRREGNLYVGGADTLFRELQDMLPSDGHLVAAHEAWRQNNVVGLRALLKSYHVTIVSPKAKATE